MPVHSLIKSDNTTLIKNLFLLFGIIFSFLIGSSIWFAACLVESKCFQNEDCEEPRICNANGECVYECNKDSDCGSGFECKNHQCVIFGNSEPLDCPEGMVSIEGAFCMDIYEASKQDATEDNEGGDASIATSRLNVIPWKEKDTNVARAACEVAGKTICTSTQWSYVCHGVQDTTYVYGDQYDPKACNGIDAYGSGNYHLAPTGSFPDCTNSFGVFDMSGNLWEQVFDGGLENVRGGAYNCSDSAKLHKCDFVPQTWVPAAIGFRCCKTADELKDE